jgi:hypothetical protein
MSTVRGPDKERKLRFARESYQEVLDATKHQDDKIGRFLTAIAFLFTGAIAFGTRTELLRVRYQLGVHLLPMPAILLGLFSVLSVLSVLLLLIGLGPNLKLPRPEREADAPTLARRRSRLFFLSIAGMTLDQWSALWRGYKPDMDDMITTYVTETHNLATKTDYKYSRTNEARAVFTLGLLFLSIFVALGFDALANSPTGVPAVFAWDQATRSVVAAIAGAFALALAYDYLRLEQELDSLVSPEKLWFRLVPLCLLVLAAPMWVASLVAPHSSAGHVFPWVAAGAATVIGVSLILLVDPGWRRAWGWRVAGIAIAIAGAFLTLSVLRDQDYLPRLGLALGAIVALELPRLLKASDLWRRRRRRALHREGWLRFRPVVP